MLGRCLVRAALCALSLHIVSCSAGASPLYQDNGNKTITDTRTGLIWQQTEGGQMDWHAAEAYCSGLFLGGYSDWRLPSVEELETLIDNDRQNPALDTTFFPDAHPWRYWSSDTDELDQRYAWFVYFSHHMVDNYGKQGVSFVRCVRGESR